MEGNGKLAVPADVARKERKYSTYKANTKVATDKDFAAVYKGTQKKDESNESDAQVKKCKAEMRRNDVIAGIFAVALQVVNFAEVEEYFREGDGKEKLVSSSLNYYLRALMLLLGFILGIHIYFHYKYRLEVDKLLKLRHDKETLKSSGLWKAMVVEMFFGMLVSPPGFDYNLTFKQLGRDLTISLDAVLFSCNLIKTYLFVRVYEQFSRWTSDNAIKICKKYKCNANVQFLVKSELKYRPYTMVSVCMVVVMVLLGLAVRTYEITYSFNQEDSAFDFDFFFNVFWLMIVTMTTVGYGDGYPSTHPGRALSFFACVMGTVLVSLMVVSLTNTSELSPGQQKVYNELIKEKARVVAEGKGAGFLMCLFYINCMNKKMLEGNTDADFILKRFAAISKLKKFMMMFKTEMKIFESHSEPSEQAIMRVKEESVTKLDMVYHNFEKADEIDSRLRNVSENMEEMVSKLEEILRFQNCIGTFLIKFNQQYKEGGTYI